IWLSIPGYTEDGGGWTFVTVGGTAARKSLNRRTPSPAGGRRRDGAGPRRALPAPGVAPLFPGGDVLLLEEGRPDVVEPLQQGPAAEGVHGEGLVQITAVGHGAALEIHRHPVSRHGPGPVCYRSDHVFRQFHGEKPV